MSHAAPPGSPASLRIKSIRDTLRISQRELASELKVTPGEVSQWESGHREVPDLVLKQIDLYEEGLGEEGAWRSEDIRTLSHSWTERLLTSSGFQKTLENDSEHSRDLRGAMIRYIEWTSPKSRLRKMLQLKMLESVARTVGRSKGLPMKATQLFSYMSPTISNELRDFLQAVELDSPRIAPSVAAAVLTQELGDSPRKLFKEWSPRPFAAASIGQVHEARLHDGTKVAVKIQYPGVQESIESDFKVITTIHSIINRFWGTGMTRVLEQLREMAVLETNFLEEAENQENYFSIFANDPDIVIPRVHRQLTSKRVITTDYIEGRLIRDFARTAPQELRDRAGRGILRFLSAPLLCHGLMQADHNPGNFLFLEDGRVGFIDFGRVARFDAESVRRNREIIHAIIVDDPKTAWKHFYEMGVFKNSEEFDYNEFWALLRLQNSHSAVDQPFRITRQYIEDYQRASENFRGKDGLVPTVDMVWTLCSCMGNWSLLAELGASVNFRRLTLEILSQAPSSKASSSKS